MTNCKKMSNLNEYIIRNLHMEVMDSNIVPVKDEIAAWKDAKQDENVIKNLEKYIGYNCLYAIDTLNGLFKQGCVIIDDDMKYIGFVETV
ncbi:hypothetical protein [Clostridium autoethanogenum]|uniref:GCN5-related N-acetyltransferase n=1 Tax=Clostridium autoethanogenum DSM 10061 TaxID=1341692 RepID=A0ABM5NZJ4_9CLOT|nr:hypothetical protein [Clostridium autoethanogenum]AGY77969.1 hypothetical protein CAETHG_3768 [Clostridium autoethanogenum DSM 10061]ALU38103.1 Hypothetical protein CLAU_3676 [Clostridium autoethanogenum DSM 10061]OVY50867.1 hypothetical protein WX72_02028 [Clostridium autoethanogenum]